MEARVRKLEASASKTQQQAWAAFKERYMYFAEAIAPIREMFLEKLHKVAQEPQAGDLPEIPGLDQAAWGCFLDKALLLLEQAESDLSIWPSDLPTPPPEPPGLWERLLERRWSQDEREVVVAGLGLMALCIARAMRD